jgi:hypothetical protein
MQPGPADDHGASELDSLRKEFPQFQIWRETAFGRARYVARGRHPHTLVTSDPDELRAVLSAGQGRP